MSGSCASAYHCIAVLGKSAACLRSGTASNWSKGGLLLHKPKRGSTMEGEVADLFALPSRQPIPVAFARALDATGRALCSGQCSGIAQGSV